MVGLIELYLEKTNERSRDRKPGSSSVIQNFSYSSHSPTSSPLSASSFPSFPSSSSSSSTSSISFPSVNNTFSCLLNGEFYYDEDFSVPFDANLTETRRQVAPPPRIFSLSPLGGSPPSPREIQITWSGGGGEANDLSFPYLTTSDVTGHDNDDVGGRVRWLGEGGGSQQPFGSLDSIQGNENDFASRSTSPDLRSTSAGDVIIVDVGKNKRTNRYPVGENSDDEIIPKFENDCRNSRVEAVTTWAGLCREKVDSNQMLGCRESSDSSEISKISHRQRNWGIIDDERKISNGDVIIENLLTWGQIKERPKTSLEIQRTVEVKEDEVEEDEDEEDDDDEDETVFRLKVSSDNNSNFDLQSHPFPVVMETSPAALETAFHKQSDDDVEVPAAMTTWRTIRASSRNGFHGDRPSGSGEVSDSLSLEGQRSSSGGRRELTSSPSSKDDGYDSVTLKDLSELSEGHVSYQLLLGDGEESSSDSETGGLIRTLRSSSEDLSQVFAIAKDNPDFDPDPELSNSTGSLNVSTSGRAKRTEPEVRASDPEFQKSITSEDAENHSHHHHHHRHLKSFYDSLVESVHSTSFRIFFESASDSVATGSLPPRGFADRSTQTSDQCSEFDSSGRNGSGKPSDGSRLRKLYSINTPLPDLSFLAKRKQQDRKDKSCTIDNSKSSSISAMNLTSDAPVILQNTQIDSSEHRNLDQIASFQSSKPGRSCKVFGPLRNQSGLHELSKEISFSTPLKPDSRTIYEDLNPVVLDNIKPENEENVDGKNIMERLVIEVCGSCQRRTVHIKNERLETNSMNTFIESLPAKDLTSRQETEQNKSDAKFGLLLDPMRTTESPASNCTRQNLLSDAIRAVELLLLHFDQDRRDKEQLGSTSSDSEIGVLVLRYLCPALSSILTHGLKSELRSYVGNVKNNVRNLIEDSVTLVGLPTFFQGIVSSLKRLKCLKAPPMFFNAFIFALLNCRVLDVWLSCVVSNALLLERHYTAESILRQSDDGSLRLIHEFLAFLQPLSLLPFSIEYDFEARVIENRRKSTGGIQRYLSHRTHAPSSTFGGRSFLEAEEIISF